MDNRFDTGGPRGQFNEPLLTAEQTAEYMQISPRHLWEISNRGDLPRIKLGRVVRYSPTDIRQYLERLKLDGGE